LADYDQIISHYPNNLAARLCRSLAAAQKKEMDAALADYEKARDSLQRRAARLFG